MKMTGVHTKHRLERYGTLALRNGRGNTVTCISGTVWLTMEGDTRDVVLAPGTSFAVDRDGLTILAAQAPSVVNVSAQNQPRTWWDRCMEFIDQTWGPAAIRPARGRFY